VKSEKTASKHVPITEMNMRRVTAMVRWLKFVISLIHQVQTVFLKSLTTPRPHISGASRGTFPASGISSALLSIFLSPLALMITVSSAPITSVVSSGLSLGAMVSFSREGANNNDVMPMLRCR